jgi:hypothetical protein
MFFEHGDRKMRRPRPLQGRKGRHRRSEIETRMFTVLKDWIYQYHRTNVMHFLFSLLRMNASTCFEHYLLIPRRRATSNTWYVACMLCKLAAAGNFNPGAANLHNMHAIYQVPLVSHLLRMSK